MTEGPGIGIQDSGREPRGLSPWQSAASHVHPPLPSEQRRRRLTHESAERAGARGLEKRTSAAASTSGCTGATGSASAGMCATSSASACSRRPRSLIVAAAIVALVTHNCRAQEPATPSATPPSTADLILVIGAAGSPEYGEQFRAWADRWQQAAESGGAAFSRIGDAPQDDTTDDRAAVAEALASAATEATRPLWLVLIGHGTFDGRTARFNLRGPDLTPNDLAAGLAPLSRPVAIVLCASGSGPFLKTLSAAGRVIVTATDGGGEVNFSRFGDFLSRAIGDASADLDKDDEVSLLEAFRTASARTDEFYAAAGRIVTEHALLDDDGDGTGTRAAALDEPQTTDGRRAGHWRLVLSETELKLSPKARAERDRLELALYELRDRKSQLAEEDYFRQLEALLVQIAELYEEAGALP